MRCDFPVESTFVIGRGMIDSASSGKSIDWPALCLHFRSDKFKFDDSLETCTYISWVIFIFINDLGIKKKKFKFRMNDIIFYLINSWNCQLALRILILLLTLLIVSSRKSRNCINIRFVILVTYFFNSSQKPSRHLMSRVSRVYIQFIL